MVVAIVFHASIPGTLVYAIPPWALRVCEGIAVQALRLARLCRVVAILVKGRVIADAGRDTPSDVHVGVVQDRVVDRAFLHA